MNQILFNKINHDQNIKNNNKKNKHKLQFLCSIFLFFITILGYFINLNFLNTRDLSSKQIAENYSILKLYNKNNQSTLISTQNDQTFTIIGMIEIPKINIYYPIISESNEELLKISPCRVSGPMPNEDGNLCIAAHNYDNYKFFSKIYSLANGDEIIIHNLDGNKLSYRVFDIYEVSENDLSPLNNIKEIKKQVTLITCNNFKSSTRIILKASISK